MKTNQRTVNRYTEVIQNFYDKVGFKEFKTTRFMDCLVKAHVGRVIQTAAFERGLLKKQENGMTHFMRIPSDDVCFKIYKQVQDINTRNKDNVSVSNVSVSKVFSEYDAIKLLKATGRYTIFKNI